MKIKAEKLRSNLDAIRGRFEHYNENMGGEDDMLDMLDELDKALTPGALVLVEAYPALKRMSKEGRWETLQPALREAYIRASMADAH